MPNLFGGNRPIYDAMTRFFREDNWKVTPIEGQPALRMGFSGKNASWVCFAQAREQQCQFIFYSVMETRVPEYMRPAVAEFLTRANYGLIVGNFEMDMRDGEVRYKTSVDIEGDELSSAIIKNLVYTNVVMMDRYVLGVMGVVFGGKSPEAAIAEIEK